jgi:hypothetical protein
MTADTWKPIKVPAEGRPIEAPGAEKLVGVDGNVFAIIGTTCRLLQRAGASKMFVNAYMAEAESGNYDHAIAASMAYLEAQADA